MQISLRKHRVTSSSTVGATAEARLATLTLIALAVLLGCRAPRQIHTWDYAEVMQQVATGSASPSPAAAALPPVAAHLAGPQPVEVYISHALSQNPEIDVARKRVDAAAYRVPQAASLEDPEVGVMGFPFYPAVPQTAMGRVTASVSASQAVPWAGTLRTRASVAEAEADAARAQLAAAELDVIEQVKRAYYELAYVQKAQEVTEQVGELLLDLTQIAESKYRTGTAGQQDVLRAQVEAADLEGELTRLRQELGSGQARLARLLHVSPDTPVRALEHPALDDVALDLDSLYQRAIVARPELHGQLAMIRGARDEVTLARLAYMPNFRFSVDYTDTTTAGAMAPTADGSGDVGIGVMANVPLYRKRLDAGVREAESRVVASAREYDSLKDQTAEAVKDLYSQATSQHELVRLFRDDIIPKAEQTLAVSQAAYQVGELDFLTLIDNWRQLLRFQISYYRLESQLRQTLAALERVVGGPLPATRPEPVPAPLPPVAGNIEWGAAFGRL